MTKRSPVRGDVQGLRALAVIAVVVNHLLKWPSGGFAGVDVFFVISGFLISGLLIREYERTDHISFVGFYRRRIRRIVPAAALVLVATVVAANALLPADRAATTRVDAVWAFLFSGNWHMALIGTDYFQKGLPPSPLQHFWSLSVEEQFYFIWPWVMLALLLTAAKFGWSKFARRNLVLAFFSAATVASFAWSLHETATQPTFAYFSTFSRAWELGVGALLAIGAPALVKIANGVRPLLAWTGLGVIVASFFVVTEAHFPAPWALAPVLGTALVVAAGTGGQQRYLFPLTNPVTKYVGNISYSLYLWHFPVVVLLLAYFDAGTTAYVASSFAAMGVLSVLSYHLVEVPTRNSKWLERGNEDRVALRIAVVTVATLAVAVGSITLSVRASDNAAAASSVADNASTSAESQTAGTCQGADFMPAAKRTCSNALPATVSPSTGRFAKDTGPEYVSCWREENDVQKICHFGSSAKDAVKVAVIGDSHGGTLLPALDDEQQLLKLNWSVDAMVGYGCQWKTAHQLGGCDEAMNEDMARFKTQKYDVIITSSARWALKDEVTDYAALEYQAAWKQVTDLGTKVIVVADNPLMSDQAISCFSKVTFKVADNHCGDSQQTALQQDDPLVVAARAPNQPLVRLVDMTDFYCHDDFCPSVIGGNIVYRDTVGHVTATYMRTLRPYLMQRITAAIHR